MFKLFVVITVFLVSCGPNEFLQNYKEDAEIQRNTDFLKEDTKIKMGQSTPEIDERRMNKLGYTRVGHSHTVDIVGSKGEALSAAKILDCDFVLFYYSHIYLHEKTRNDGSELKVYSKYSAYFYVKTN